MKLWIDDVRPAPEGWHWAHSVDEAIAAVNYYEHCHNLFKNDCNIFISLDHDSGDYYKYGGDFIRLLDYLEAWGVVDNSYQFHIHSMNPVGIENMRAIIRKNGWQEI